MNFSEILATVDSYAREYIRYVLSIANPKAFKDAAGDFEPKLINFSLISVVIASYLFDRFVRHAAFSQGIFIDDAVRDFSTWLFITLVLYFGLNFRSRLKISFNHALSVVLRILPVAFVLAAYIATVVTQVSQVFTQWLGLEGCSSWYGFGVLSLVQGLVTLVYMPISIARYAEHDRVPGPCGPEERVFEPVRIRCLAMAVVGLIVLIRGSAVFIDLSGAAKVSLEAETAACARVKTCGRGHDRSYFMGLELSGLEGCFWR